VLNGIYEVCNKGTQIILLEAFAELLFQGFDENTKFRRKKKSACGMIT
jgi:hypothetical protein